MIIIAALLIGAALMTTITYAWLQQDQESRHTLVTSSVTIAPAVSFVKAGVPEGVAGESFMYNGYYIVDLNNPAADNYYTKLRVKIQFKGVTKSYIRVHLADMGVVETYEDSSKVNNIYLKENTEFNMDHTRWVDNRIYDDYYYYIHDMGYGRGIFRTETELYETELDFISGISGISDVENGKMYLDIQAEAVQFNRIETFWGMNDLSEIIGDVIEP